MTEKQVLGIILVGWVLALLLYGIFYAIALICFSPWPIPILSLCFAVLICGSMFFGLRWLDD